MYLGVSLLMFSILELIGSIWLLPTTKEQMLNHYKFVGKTIIDEENIIISLNDSERLKRNDNDYVCKVQIDEDKDTQRIPEIIKYATLVNVARDGDRCRPVTETVMYLSKSKISYGEHFIYLLKRRDYVVAYEAIV